MGRILVWGDAEIIFSQVFHPLPFSEQHIKVIQIPFLAYVCCYVQNVLNNTKIYITEVWCRTVFIVRLRYVSQSIISKNILLISFYLYLLFFIGTKKINYIFYQIINCLSDQ